MTTRRHRYAAATMVAVALAITGHQLSANAEDWSPGPAAWKGDLTPITAADWSYDRGGASAGGGPASAARRRRFRSSRR